MEEPGRAAPLMVELHNASKELEAAIATMRHQITGEINRLMSETGRRVEKWLIPTHAPLE